MKLLSAILAIALLFCIYLLYSQHKELYDLDDPRGMENCLLDEKEAREYIKLHKDSFCTDPNKTEAVWFSEDLIRCLYLKIIREDKKDTVDGFRVYLATYPSGKVPRTTRARVEADMANTVLFVPTSPLDSGKNHRDLWDLIKKDAIIKLFEKKYAAPNHGELCPQVCN